MTDTLTYIGDLTDDLLYGAITPNESTLYAFELNRGFDIREYAYPALTGGSIVVNNVIGPMAIDDTGVLYWTDDAVIGATAATEIWKNISSPTLLWSSAYASVNPTVTFCWSPYDGLLYALVSGVLYSIDPSTGAATSLFTPSVGSPGIANGPVATLDGGIWWSFSVTSSSFRVMRYDIPGASGAEATVGPTNYQDQLLPKQDHTTLGVTSLGTSGWTIATNLTASVNTDIAGLVGGFRAVTYTPDLSLVVFGARSSNGVWEMRPAGNPWSVGRVSWGSRGAWH